MPVWGEDGDDLLSGRYWIRTRLDTIAMPTYDDGVESRYPVADIATTVEDTSQLAKLRRTDGQSTPQARISAQPNPVRTATEIRFSVPVRDYVRVSIYDSFGREVARPLERALLDAGRYAIDTDVSGLRPGRYVVELSSSRARALEKIVIVR